MPTTASNQQEQLCRHVIGFWSLHSEEDPSSGLVQLLVEAHFLNVPAEAMARCLLDEKVQAKFDKYVVVKEVVLRTTKTTKMKASSKRKKDTQEKEAWRLGRRSRRRWPDKGSGGGAGNGGGGGGGVQKEQQQQQQQRGWGCRLLPKIGGGGRMSGGGDGSRFLGAVLDSDTVGAAGASTVDGGADGDGVGAGAGGNSENSESGANSGGGGANSAGGGGGGGDSSLGVGSSEVIHHEMSFPRPMKNRDYVSCETEEHKQCKQAIKQRMCMESF
jgi:hypothetical protein